jgi:hypothetical protein
LSDYCRSLTIQRFIVPELVKMRFYQSGGRIDYLSFRVAVDWRGFFTFFEQGSFARTSAKLFFWYELCRVDKVVLMHPITHFNSMITIHTAKCIAPFAFYSTFSAAFTTTFFSKKRRR